MRCKKCGNQLSSDANFCDVCGEPVHKENNIKKILLRCEHCGGTLEIDDDKEVISCPFCGSKSIILDNDNVQIEKIRANTYKEVEFAKLKKQSEEEKRISKKEKVNEFKKGKIAKLLKVGLIVSLLLSCYNFLNGKIFSGIVAGIQTICCFGALCLGYQLIVMKSKRTYFILLLLSLLLIIPNVLLNKSNKAKPKDDYVNNEELIEEIDWNVIDLKDLIPEPNSKRIKIFHNDTDWLSIDIYDITESYVYSYIHQCETEYNFNIDPNKPTSTYFEAHNQDGYEINVWLVTDEYMNISLYSPIEYDYYELPLYAINENLPIPKSSLGFYKWKYDDNFLLIVGNTTREEYEKYVKQCIEAGFTLDDQNGIDFYNGKNENGFSISISYVGYNKMTINFKSPK